MEIGKFDDSQASLVVSVVLGFVAPYLTALLNHRNMSDQARVLVAVAVALLAAIMQTLMTRGNLNFASMATAFAVIFPVGQTFYRNVALKFGVRELEDATSPATMKPAADAPLPTSSVGEAVEAIKQNEAGK